MPLERRLDERKTRFWGSSRTLRLPSPFGVFWHHLHPTGRHWSGHWVKYELRHLPPLRNWSICWQLIEPHALSSLLMIYPLGVLTILYLSIFLLVVPSIEFHMSFLWLCLEHLPISYSSRSRLRTFSLWAIFSNSSSLWQYMQRGFG